MEKIIQKEFSGLMGKVEQTLSRPDVRATMPGIDRAYQNMDIKIGLATDSRFAVDGDVCASPAYAGTEGDKHFGGDIGMTGAMDSVFKNNPDLVTARIVYDDASKKFYRKWEMKGAKDSFGAKDAVGSILTGSTLSPSAISWFTKPFIRPLAWSNAMKLVSVNPGTSPWAEVMEMATADISSPYGNPNVTGNADNQMTNDIEVISGAIAQPIMNIETSYKLTVQELERSKAAGSSVPWAGQLINVKQSMARWVLDIIRDSIIYYGNSATGNPGILNINNVVTWSTVGTVLATLAGNADTNKGQEAYQQLSTAVINFLTPLQNKPSKVCIAMSPYAYNLLAQLPYSQYNPNSALKIMMDNFLSGENKEGTTPDIEIYPDPMLSSTSSTVGTVNAFNAQAYDYMVITAPELGTGPMDEPQPLLQFGYVLPDFVYPVIPNSFSTNYRYLRRMSGIFAPLTTAVAIYSGYGSVA